MKIGRDRPTGGVTTDARVRAMTDLERTDTLLTPQAWWSGDGPDAGSGRIDMAAVPA